MEDYIVTIFATKTGRYIHHGYRLPDGGIGATGDNGLSLNQAIRYEESRLAMGTKYRIEKNGKLFENIFVKC